MNPEVDRYAITLPEGQTDIGLRNPSEEGYPQQPDLLKIAHFMAINNANISSFNRKEVVDAIKEGKNVTKIRDVFYTPDEYGLYIPEKDRIEVSLQIETNKLFELIEKRDKRLREIEILKQYLNNPRNNGRPHDLKSIEGQIESLKKRLQNLNSVLRRELMDNNPPPQPEPTVDKFAHLFRGLSDIEDHDNGKDSLPPGVTAGIVVAGAIGLTNSKLRKGAYVATAIATASGLVLSACQPQPPAIVQQEQGDATQDPLVHDGNKPTVTFVSENPTSEPSPSPTPNYEYEDGNLVITSGEYKIMPTLISGESITRNNLKVDIQTLSKDIMDQAKLISGSNGDAIALINSLNCKVSSTGNIIFEVKQGLGDETYPDGTLFQFVSVENNDGKQKQEVRIISLDGAIYDLNQFQGFSEVPEDWEVPENWKVKPTELYLEEDIEGNPSVKAIIRKKDPKTKKETIEIVGEVDIETGDWKRTNKVAYTKITNEDKTETAIVWEWTPRIKTEDSRMESPAMRPYMKLADNEKFYVDDHGGVKDIEITDDGQTVFILRDGSKVSVVGDENTRHLEFPSAEERVKEWLDRLDKKTWIGKDKNGIQVNKEYLEKKIAPILVKYLEYCQDTNFQDTCIPQDVRDLVQQRLAENFNPLWAQTWLKYGHGFTHINKISGSTPERGTLSYPTDIGRIAVYFDNTLDSMSIEEIIRINRDIIKEGAFVQAYTEALRTKNRNYYPNFNGMSSEERDDMYSVLSVKGTMLIGEAVTIPYDISFLTFVKKNIGLFSNIESEQRIIINNAERQINFYKGFLRSSDALRRINPSFP